MKRLLAALAETPSRALLVVARSSGDPYVAPFVGDARVRDCLLLMPIRGEPCLAFLSPLDRDEAARSGLRLLAPAELDVERWARDGAPPERFLADVLGRALQLAGVAPGRIALAGQADGGTLQAACALLAEEGWSFLPAETMVRRWRKRKTAAEVGEVERVASTLRAAMRHVAQTLARADSGATGGLSLAGEPLTVGRLRSEVGRLFAEHGLEQPEGQIFAAGGDGAVPHSSSPPERVLRAGEPLVVDLFPKGRLFVDCTRTFCVGSAPPPLAAAHRAVADTLAALRAGATPGVTGWSLHEKACELFGALGYPTTISDRGTTRGFVHGLGHGVGYELHEAPGFRAQDGADGVLEEGDVFVLEPGLYEPDEGWAVRLEDLFVMTAEGPECLTELPRELDPKAW